METNANTCIPDSLIDRHLTKAKPEYIALYLYAKRWAKENNYPTISKTAADLSMRELDVMAGVQYWESAGLVRIIDGSLDRFAYEMVAVGEEKPKIKEPVPETLIRPSYDMKDIAQTAENNEEIRYLFNMAERLFGRTLTYNDMNLLLGFYDWMTMPIPVIEVLLDYCVTNGKKNSRYMERVAMNWVDEGITTVAEAEAYIKLFTGDYRAIMKALGHSRRDPAPKETAFMRKWLREYKMPLELVTEACGRTVVQTGGTNIAYVDKIITHWHEQGITTLEMAETENKEFKEQQSQLKQREPASKKSRYAAGYKGRDWNFEELDKLIAAAQMSE